MIRLGVDLDGTVADMQSALAREARLLFADVDPEALPHSTPSDSETTAIEGGDPAPAAEAAWGTHMLTSRQQHALWNAVRSRENFWETLDEIEPGAVARLARMVRARKWEVLFLTSRPQTVGDSAQLQSHRWLAAHGFASPSVFVVHGSRGKIASALGLDTIVDDRPENCLDVAIDSSARAILIWRGDADSVPASARQLGIGAVSSMAECLDILESLDSSSQTGVVDRLKRLLGLKTRAVRFRGPVAPANPAVDVATANAASPRR
jgi:hypothetical protein